MKTIMAIITSTSFMLAAFTPVSISDTENRKVVQEFAEAVTAACRNQSVDAYLSLFPGLSEFQKVMESNANQYGPYLEEAQNEFAYVYTEDLLPSVKESFSSLIHEGKSRNIDWSTVQLSSVELGNDTSNPSLTLSITSGEQKFKIEFKKILTINGQLKVSQFVKLS